MRARYSCGWQGGGKTRLSTGAFLCIWSQLLSLSLKRAGSLSLSLSPSGVHKSRSFVFLDCNSLSYPSASFGLCGVVFSVTAPSPQFSVTSQGSAEAAAAIPIGLLVDRAKVKRQTVLRFGGFVGLLVAGCVFVLFWMPSHGPRVHEMFLSLGFKRFRTKPWLIGQDIQESNYPCEFIFIFIIDSMFVFHMVPSLVPIKQRHFKKKYIFPPIIKWLKFCLMGFRPIFGPGPPPPRGGKQAKKKGS